MHGLFVDHNDKYLKGRDSKVCKPRYTPERVAFPQNETVFFQWDGRKLPMGSMTDSRKVPVSLLCQLRPRNNWASNFHFRVTNISSWSSGSTKSCCTLTGDPFIFLKYRLPKTKMAYLQARLCSFAIQCFGLCLNSSTAREISRPLPRTPGISLQKQSTIENMRVLLLRRCKGRLKVVQMFVPVPPQCNGNRCSWS